MRVEKKLILNLFSMRELLGKIKELAIRVWRNQTLRRYVHSSVVTFLAFFLPLVLLELKQMGVESFQEAGLFSLMGVLIRLAMKALYEMFIVLLSKK